MKYFPYNEEAALQIKTIRKRIRLAMNGVSADAMKEAGIIYKANYGLSLPKIREIAQSYSPNSLLAQQLWELKIRESMILATLIHPKESFNEALCEAWMQDVPTQELCEHLALNLLQHRPYIKEKTITWLESDDSYKNTTAFLVLSRITQQLSKEDITFLFKKIKQMQNIEDKPRYHAISVYLRFLCRLSPQQCNDIALFIKDFKESPYLGAKYIYQEVRMEIEFMQ